MESSFILQPPIIALAIACLALFFIFIFGKMVKDPKLGIYLVIISTPFMKSFGAGTFMARFTLSEVAGLLLFSAWFLNQTLVSDRGRPSSTSFTPVAWGLWFVLLLSVFVNFADYTHHARWIVKLMILLYLLIFYTFLVFRNLLYQSKF